MKTEQFNAIIENQQKRKRGYHVVTRTVKK